MSKAYREMFGTEKVSKEDMREFLRPKFKYDEKGKPVYTTEQAHKDICDVNKIIRKYDKTGLITHINQIEAEFGDMTGLDFMNMQNKLVRARSMFDALPSAIRNRFGNNPAELLKFMESPDNRDEAIKLGLIRNTTPVDKDGLGEHVPDADK